MNVNLAVIIKTVMKITEFIKAFPDNEACKNHFKSTRINQGITCKKCKSTNHKWLTSKDQFECKHCRFRTTLKSGTVMENSKLTYFEWYITMHLMSSTKKSFSAAEIQRQLGRKRYQPVWEMCHKIRIILGHREDQYKLHGEIEMDEGFFKTFTDNEVDGVTGKRGRGSEGRSEVLVSVESEYIKPKDRNPKYKNKPTRKVKYLKMRVMNDLKSNTINEATKSTVAEDSEVTTDGYRGYNSIKKLVKKHKVVIANTKKKLDTYFPWVHSTIGNSKRILTGIHHLIKDKYLQNYLDEFCYKFNRRYFGEALFSRILACGAMYYWNLAKV